MDILRSLMITVRYGKTKKKKETRLRLHRPFEKEKKKFRKKIQNPTSHLLCQQYFVIVPSTYSFVLLRKTSVILCFRISIQKREIQHCANENEDYLHGIHNNPFFFSTPSPFPPPTILYEIPRGTTATQN